MLQRYVLDASVVVKWYFAEVWSDEARQLLTQYEEGRADFCAPDLLAAELANVFWKRQRRGELSEEQAEKFLASFMNLRILWYESRSLAGEALRLSMAVGCTAYDAIYIALVRQLEVFLITADETLRNTLQDRPEGSLIVTLSELSA